MRTRIASILLITLLLFGVSGCARAEQLTVTATFYPLYVAALNIVGDAPGVAVESLAPPAAGCLHDYQLTTADRRALSDTDVLLVNGAGLETFLEKLLPALSARVIDASEGLTLLEDAHGDANPHIWVSVAGMREQTENLIVGLCAADPANAALDRENGKAYLAKLLELEVEMAVALAPYQGAKIVTFHEAFDYFAQSYGLDVVAVVQQEHDTAPSAKELAQLSDTIRAEKVKALFAEPQYEDMSVDILHRETGVPVYLLDPVVTGAQGVPDADAYLTIMRQNLATLLEALP